MARFKNSIFYVLTLALAGLCIYFIIEHGKGMEAAHDVVHQTNTKDQWSVFIESMHHNLRHPLAILLAQIVTIILVARMLGWVSKKIGQPAVIGEIAAGIILGPSLVGMYLPEFSEMLFPVESLANLQFLSQIGLILFMFVVGMELDLTVLKNKASEAVVISHASIVFPFTLGFLLAYTIYHEFAPVGVPFASFALFIGIAMSITAFPVLARIVHERGLHKTRLGAVVITCAAADDITAWCLLAAVIAIVKAGSFVSSLYVILLSLAYVLVMFFGVRPFLRRIGDLHSGQDNLARPIVAIFFLILIISAYATEVIGIHALFGAFMAGVVMPESMKFRTIIVEKVEDVALVLLLPLFFVFTGLRTQIGLLDSWDLWKTTFWIIGVAVAGKFLGSAFAAKFVGQGWKESLTIGALMNTRGLMELVVLNIGYDLGVLSPTIFAMMVIMALFTTFMTGPALDLINFAFRRKDLQAQRGKNIIDTFKLLISFGSAEGGKSLLKLANAFVKKSNGDAQITAMHLANSAEFNQFNSYDYEKETFAPLLSEAKDLNQKIITLFKVSSDIEDDITSVANKGGYDLLLIGLGQSIYQGSLLGKLLGFTTKIINPDRLLNTVMGKESIFDNWPFDERTRWILSYSNVPVGIFLDKSFEGIKKIFVLHNDPKDGFILKFTKILLDNTEAEIVILDTTNKLKLAPELRANSRLIRQSFKNVSISNIYINIPENTDLMLISFETWKRFFDSESTWLNEAPSMLLMRE